MRPPTNARPTPKSIHAGIWHGSPAKASRQVRTRHSRKESFITGEKIVSGAPGWRRGSGRGISIGMLIADKAMEKFALIECLGTLN